MKEIIDWIQNIRGLMEAGGLPKSLNEAESMIEEHQQRKASIIIASNWIYSSRVRQLCPWQQG